MPGCPSWASNLAIDYECESTCILDSISWTLDPTFCITKVRAPKKEITLSMLELLHRP